MRRETFLDPPGNRWSVNVATTRGERVRGLRGRPGLREYEALLLPRARSVHTFGIRVPITVVLLDRDYRVIGIRHLPPRRLLLPRPGVRHVMECGPMADLRVGDVLRLEAAAGRKGRRID